MARNRDGFTLIELLVVIGIIGILGAIIFPVFSQSREKARRSVCQSNLRQIGIALLTYVDDWDGKFPPSYARPWVNLGTSHTASCQLFADAQNPFLRWEPILEPIIKNREVYHCPSAKQLWAVVTIDERPEPCQWPYPQDWKGFVTGVNFNRSGLTDKSLAQIGQPSQFVMVADTSHPEQNTASTRLGMSDHTTSASTTDISTPSADDAAPHNGGNNLAFIDGHVKWYHWRQMASEEKNGSLLGLTSGGVY